MPELTDAQKQIIKASIPVLEQSGVDLTYGFYSHMFATHPEVLPYFNQAHHESKRQPKILAHALLQYAKNIDDLTPLTSFVNHVVAKHVGLQIKAEHYPVVGECLLYQLHKMLGDDVATPVFLEAWGIAYQNLADILISAEAAKYKEMGSMPNGWMEFKKFYVADIVPECDDVKSVYFKPCDGGDLVVPEPGQYICVRLLPDTNIITQREYTLSESFNPEHGYRISVRHDPNGVASTFVHSKLQRNDVVEISQPSGQLEYVNTKDASLVIVAGGIGITPMIPILEYGLKQNRQAKVIWSCKQIKTTPFQDYFKQLLAQYPDTLKFQLLITDEDKENSLSQESKVKNVLFRRIEESDFAQCAKGDDYYVVGPHGFTNFVTAALGAKGVADIHTEEYGPITV